MKKIEDLSKEELLGLIYHQLPDTLFREHPCECAACGCVSAREIEFRNEKYKVYFYCCDNCEKYD